jgi:hypothetical protein
MRELAVYAGLFKCALLPFAVCCRCPFPCRSSTLPYARAGLPDFSNVRNSSGLWLHALLLFSSRQFWNHAQKLHRLPFGGAGY